MKKCLFLLFMIFCLYLIACKGNKHKVLNIPECNFNTIKIFSRLASTPKDSLLLPTILCAWKTVSVDTPCCDRDRILMDVDKNYNTTLLQTYSHGSEVDLFADKISDLTHFHKIIELQFADSFAYQLNRVKLSSVDDSKPAFRTVDKGTLAWRLKPLFTKHTILLTFSNTKSKYIPQVSGILDSIVSTQ